MGCILIAMPKREDSDHISALIRKHGLLDDINVCDTAAEVLREANARDFGVIICTKNLKDMSCIELGEYRPKFFGMIVLTKDVALETIDDDMVKLITPFKSHDLIATIEMLTSKFYHEIKKKKKAPLDRSGEEKKIIDEAKAVLMDRNGMTEPEAFRYIQKISMDAGRRMSETAQMILMME